MNATRFDRRRDSELRQLLERIVGVDPTDAHKQDIYESQIGDLIAYINANMEIHCWIAPIIRNEAEASGIRDPEIDDATIEHYIRQHALVLTGRPDR